MQTLVIGPIEYPAVELLAEERDPWSPRYTLKIENRDGLIITESCEDKLYLVERLKAVIIQGGTGHITDQLAAGDGIIARRWIPRKLAGRELPTMDHRRQA
jgi:hypothetical protein